MRSARPRDLLRRLRAVEARRTAPHRCAEHMTRWEMRAEIERLEAGLPGSCPVMEADISRMSREEMLQELERLQSGRGLTP